MLNQSNYTILLVEDDANDILLIRRAFRKINAINPIHIVKDGEEAIAYLQGQGEYGDRDTYPLPLLMLLDLKLPRKSGLEVLEWLRQQPNLKRLPVVVLTASRENADINVAYDIGINSYLIKPPNFKALQNMLGDVNNYWLSLNQQPILK
ncbi:response regulator [Phormidium sp. CCY1219]|jgi:CheY-like chemotaxis protein|uniref:response regulator n=1 Tax=Phormidium sp. CCY1219 TaxID=2886104 RepID=UPI002D1E7AED|nr:response regulator [Phormidium sp. CCY1219]MEB3831082.1 response regulator [Phormidium sp. CCY1219]